MTVVSFKERVKNEAIINAKLYKVNFVDYEYLVCSCAFSNGYKIIKSDKGNYLHLLGIHTELSPVDFFEKCYSGFLEETDFDFNKPGQSPKSVKGSVRDKIQVLPHMVTLFTKELLAEENFRKNRIECAFATTDQKCTLGFATANRPKSLLKGNELDSLKTKKVDLIFRKKRSSPELYTEMLFGDSLSLERYKTILKDIVSPDLFK